MAKQREISTQQALKEADNPNYKSQRLSRYAPDLDPGDQPASYGFTHRSLEEERIDQVRGRQKMTRCNIDPRFPIPLCEAEWIYVLIQESPLFDHKTGMKLSKPILKKFNSAAMALMEKMNAFRGSRVIILNDPSFEGNKEIVFEAPDDLSPHQKADFKTHAGNYDMAKEMLLQMGLPTELELTNEEVEEIKKDKEE